MTDARLPERWLNDRRVRRLPDDAFRLFVNSLLWSVANKTDGVLYDDDLPLIPGAGSESHLVKADLWKRVTDYWLITDFADTQSSRDELDALAARRRADRKRKAAERARKAADPAEPAVSRDVSRDSHAERIRPGQARPGALRGSDRQQDSCTEDECTSTARAGCRTCWEHAYLETA